MVASSSPPSPLPRHRRLARPALEAAAVMAVLVLVPLPVGANHVQNITIDGATYTVEFDHDGDNEWWAEFQARAGNGDGFFIGWAQVEGSATWHYMQFAANSWERQQQGWSKFEPDQNFQVPPGKRVRFAVGMTDGSSDSVANQVVSCWFTHPAGGEQCDQAPPSTTFDPPVTGFRGNEWWVQANVGTDQHCISKVDVRSNNGAWMPLKKQSWGPTAWAASYHFPQDSILQMRATACDGRTDLSSCRQWIPPANTDARIVPCSGGGTIFDATFSGVKGNNWWVQTSVSAKQPIQDVDARINCSEEWRSLTRQSWGGWAASFHVPSGSKVDFRATSTVGNQDISGGYIWPQATPTSNC